MYKEIHKTFCIGCLFNFGIFSTVLPHELLWFSFNFFLLNTISHVLQTTFLVSYNVIVLISSSSTKTSFGGESGQSFAEMISVSPPVNSQYQISIKFAKFQCYSKDDMWRKKNEKQLLYMYFLRILVPHWVHTFCWKLLVKVEKIKSKCHQNNLWKTLGGPDAKKKPGKRRI